MSSKIIFVNVAHFINKITPKASAIVPVNNRLCTKKIIWYIAKV